MAKASPMFLMYLKSLDKAGCKALLEQYLGTDVDGNEDVMRGMCMNLAGELCEMPAITTPASDGKGE